MSNLPQIVSHSLLPDVQNVCCLLAYLSLSGYSGHPTPPIKLHDIAKQVDLIAFQI